jgi:hypothetical protein
MAKVAGPLGSFEASGRIGQYCVHFNWKGINVVRKWTKPTNPQTTLQGNVRTFTGGIGRATKPVMLGSQYQKRVLLTTPTGMTWVSYIVKTLADIFHMNVSDLATEYGTVSPTVQTAFQNKAIQLGLVDFMAPGATTGFGGHLMLFALYRFGRQKYLDGISEWDKAPYNVAPSSLTTTDVDNLVTDITTQP